MTHSLPHPNPRIVRGSSLLVAGAAFIVLLGAGVSCRRSAEVAATAERHEEPVLLLRGTGLKLSGETFTNMGLHLVGVGERAVGSTLEATAQVFRDATESTSVSGTYRKGFAYASASLAAPFVEERRPGMAVSLTKRDDASPGIEGRVVRVDSSLQAATRTAEAILEFPDPTGQWPIGTFAVAVFKQEASRPMLAVPRAALLRAGEGDFVYAKNGRSLLRLPVKVAAADAEWAAVSGEIQPGDVVVSKGVEALWLTELALTQAGGCTH
jgi:multidrug efflux pump subunit AcrA (membrane-fusion protein)